MATTRKRKIKVVWLNGAAWNFCATVREAHELVATLKMAGFSDAQVSWAWGEP